MTGALGKTIARPIRRGHCNTTSRAWLLDALSWAVESGGRQCVMAFTNGITQSFNLSSKEDGSHRSFLID
jgi:hypothetical protein